jgi:hypothetical protein
VASDSDPLEPLPLFDARTDLVLAEGYAASGLAKLEVFPPTGASVKPRAMHGVIATVRAPRPLEGIPDFGDEQLSALADFVLRWRESGLPAVAPGPAPEALGPEVSLFLDGRPLPLKPFLAKMLEGIVLRFLASLKWVGAPARIELTIQRRSKAG